MGKKKKKKSGMKIGGKNYSYNSLNVSDKKSLKKNFKSVLDDIEVYQIEMMEADKKARRKKKRDVNKQQYIFLKDIDSIKARKKISKKWEKTGFLDTILEMLGDIAPYVKLLARAVCTLIIAFLSIDGIKKVISPNILAKVTKVFDIALSI